MAGVAECPESLSQQSSNSHSVTKDRRCRYFFSVKGCAVGDACKFSHDIKNQNEASQPQTTRPKCKFYASGYCKWGNSCGFLHVRPPRKPSTPEVALLTGRKLSEVSESEIAFLRKSEIGQLKRRYPKRKDVSDSVYAIVFYPSDPDWPYDVKSVNLQLNFPDLYPKHVLSVEIVDDDSLPRALSRHLVRKMNDWLVERLEENVKKNSIDLSVKPFFKWLDKSLEQFFTEGLTMYKRELAAKAAGLTFLSPVELKEQYSAGEDTENSDSESAQSDVAEDDTKENEIIEKTSSLDINQSTTDKEAKPDDSQTSFNSKLDPPRRGTELRLKKLELSGCTGTLHCSIVRIGLRCARCKTVHHVTMHPNRPYVVVCDRCRSKMAIIFHPSLMHMASSTAGFLDLDACQPFDLVLQDCQMVAGCLNCNKENLVHGLQQESTRTFWCIACHKKMSITTEKGSFLVLNDGPAIKIGADAVLIAKKARPKSELRILAEGKPLPDKGACQHYKKSFRWFRFPCCGKLYPCDKCHDEKEVDHEMEMANRMICGFCSKEQGFSLTKPCVQCDASMTRAKSQHWEGGQGCRNKLQMAKGDKHKFAGSNKTISKKSVSATKKTGAKTTHVRHTT